MRQQIYHPIQALRYWFNSRVGIRLAAGFAIMSALMIMMSLAGAWQLWQQNQQFTDMLDTSVAHMTQLQAISTEVSTVSVAARDALLSSDEASNNASLARIERAEQPLGSR